MVDQPYSVEALETLAIVSCGSYGGRWSGGDGEETAEEVHV